MDTSTYLRGKWTQILKMFDAWWTHSGNPQDPHAILSSGLHSNLYVNCRIIFTKENYLEEAAHDMVSILRERVDFQRVDTVGGIVTSGARIAEAVGRFLGVPSFSITVDRGSQSVLFSREPQRFSRILLFDDILSTAGTIRPVITELQKKRCEILNPLSFFINRSHLAVISGYPVCSLVSHPGDVWEKDTCPLCAQGSPALSLEGKKNWRDLTR